MIEFIESPQHEVDDSDGFLWCPSCKTHRDPSALDPGTTTCPFCDTTLEDPAAPAAPSSATPVTGYATSTLPEATPDETRDILDATTTRQPAPSPDKPTSQTEEEAFKIAYARPQASIDQIVERELASRVLCRRRLMPLIQKFRPKYLPGWVHVDICRRLEQFVKDVEDGLEPRLLLMMPPRGGKSEIGSRNLPAWILGKHPDWEIIAASHTASLTMSFSRYVRDMMRDPAYQAIFADTRLDPSSQSIENWNTTAGGGYLAAGVGTGITGRGAHVLLLDDLVKDMEAADSQTIRDNTWEWYASTAYTRLAPGGGVIGIMTWWHDDDWAGRIQQVMASGDGDRFEIIKYPAINDVGDEYILDDQPGRPIIQVPPGYDVPPNAIKTRDHNTALHPARYTTDAMNRIKRNLFAAGQQRVWNALYQQNPLPDEGILFKKDMFRYYPELPHPQRCHIYQAWDFAITEGQENDYTVGATIYQDERDNLYVADIRRFKSGDSFVIVDEILDYAKEWNVTTLGFEDGQIWKAMQAVFDKRCQERRQYPSYEILKPLTDKFVRAAPLRGRMQLGKVYFPEDAPWFRELFMEMTRFPNVKHDDQIDALAWATRLTLTSSAPRPLETRQRPLKSWKDKLSQFTGQEGGVSHMAA